MVTGCVNCDQDYDGVGSFLQLEKQSYCCWSTSLEILCPTRKPGLFNWCIKLVKVADGNASFLHIYENL